MRTVLAPLAPEIEAQLAAMDSQLRAVTEGYIARLRLEPHLGRPVPRGLLAWAEARAVLFNRDERPDQLLGDHRGALRVAGEDASAGPRYRVIYRLHEAPGAGVRVVQVLAVGEGHAADGEDAYRAATRLLDGLLKSEKRRKR